MDLDNFFLDKEQAVLLIVDIQERLAAVMSRKDEVVKNNQHLIELAKLIGLPVVVTEQYPKGLGRTVPALLSSIPGCRPIEKMTFDCCGQDGFIQEIRNHAKKTVILTGMETHICVLQTCIGLLKSGLNVHVVQDAICSRTEENWKAGLDFMRDAGGVITCTETVLFQLLKIAGTEQFKKISQLIR
jgi:nicotinamidase-related amidase